MPKGVHLPRVEKACKFCGNLFSCVGSDKDRVFCSNSCKLAGCAVRPKICEECGGQFMPVTRKTQKFCGIHCRNKYRARLRHGLAKGENTKARKRELLKSHGQCQLCGWKEVPEVLEIHHKDRDNSNNDWDNLILLCPNCHSVEHYNAKDGQYTMNLGVRHAADKEGRKAKTEI